MLYKESKANLAKGKPVEMAAAIDPSGVDSDN
jgi:hypothetical protein